MIRNCQHDISCLAAVLLNLCLMHPKKPTPRQRAMRIVRHALMLLARDSAGADRAGAGNPHYTHLLGHGALQLVELDVQWAADADITCGCIWHSWPVVGHPIASVLPVDAIIGALLGWQWS